MDPMTICSTSELVGDGQDSPGALGGVVGDGQVMDSSPSRVAVNGQNGADNGLADLVGVRRLRVDRVDLVIDWST